MQALATPGPVPPVLARLRDLACRAPAIINAITWQRLGAALAICAALGVADGIYAGSAEAALVAFSFNLMR